MNLNTMLTISCITAIVIFTVIIYLRAKHSAVKIVLDELDTFLKVFENIKQRLVSLDKGDISPTLSAEDFEREYRRKARTREALINCVHGIESAKIIVIDLIRNFIAEDVKSEVITQCRQAIGFL